MPLPDASLMCLRNLDGHSEIVVKRGRRRIQVTQTLNVAKSIVGRGQCPAPPTTQFIKLFAESFRIRHFHWLGIQYGLQRCLALIFIAWVPLVNCFAHDGSQEDLPAHGRRLEPYPPIVISQCPQPSIQHTHIVAASSGNRAAARQFGGSVLGDGIAGSGGLHYLQAGRQDAIDQPGVIGDHAFQIPAQLQCTGQVQGIQRA
jgi:hypothetical protein